MVTGVSDSESRSSSSHLTSHISVWSRVKKRVLTSSPLRSPAGSDTTPARSDYLYPAPLPPTRPSDRLGHYGLEHSTKM